MVYRRPAEVKDSDSDVGGEDVEVADLDKARAVSSRAAAVGSMSAPSGGCYSEGHPVPPNPKNSNIDYNFAASSLVP